MYKNENKKGGGHGLVKYYYQPPFVVISLRSVIFAEQTINQA